jgi:hypothetical protein
MPTSGKRPNILKKSTGYRDIFPPANRRKTPLIMADRMRITWPAGWTKEDVERWRKLNNLLKP